jgi:restriction endonuclease Mrr
MAIPSSQVAANWVREDLDSTSWIPLRELVFQTVKQRLVARTDDEVWDYVEANLAYIAEHLRDAASEYVSDGAIPEFEIDNEPIPYVRSLPSLPTSVLSKLRKIDPFHLEEVCARLLGALGADSNATQRTNDGGIDFIGVNLAIVPGALTIPLACKAAVIGQTKRYKEGNTITETQVREFVGAATLKRHELLREGKLGPLTPVLFAFWTTSDFDPNAKRFARAVGLWYMEGLTLASYVSNLGLEDHLA